MTGAQRYARDRAMGIQDRAVRLPMDPVANDEMAAAAESWFAAMFGLEAQVQHSRPTPCDLVAKVPGYARACIDIKWTPRPDGGLMLYDKGTRQHFCVAYVLVVGPQQSAFALGGWAWGFVLRTHTRSDLPRPAYYLAREDLRPHVDILMAASFRRVRA